MNLFKAPILLALTCLLSFGSYSQDDDDEVVTGEVVLDDVEDLFFLRFQVPIWEMSLAKHNLSLFDFPIGLHGNINDDFSFKTVYNIQLLDRLNYDGTSGDIYSTRSPFFANSLTAEGTYYFYKNVVKEEVELSLKSVGNVNYVTNVQANTLKRFGINFGIKTGYTSYNLRENTISGLNLIEPELGAQPLSSSKASTQLTYNHLILGVQFSKLTNVKVNTDQYGAKSNSKWINYSLNAIIPITSKFDNVYAPFYMNGQQFFGATLEYNIDDHADKVPIGFLLSSRVVPINKGIFGINIEGGYFPGLKGNGDWFFNLGVSFYLGPKTRFYKDA